MIASVKNAARCARQTRTRVSLIAICRSSMSASGEPLAKIANRGRIGNVLRAERVEIDLVLAKALYMSYRHVPPQRMS